jgi:hypothetical protein
MKTSELIEALAADPNPRGVSPRSGVVVALVVGAAVSAALFLVMVGPRADIGSAVRTLRFDLKFVDTLALALPSALLCLSLLRPDARPGALALMLAAPLLLLAGAVIVELLVVPPELWGARLIGTNAVHCLTLIPLLSIPPLLALIYAMRAGAPQNPTSAGALAGAAAAGIAATLYAANCPDDSPLFVASWYPLATLVVVAVGAAAGARLLRW